MFLKKVGTYSRDGSKRKIIDMRRLTATFLATLFLTCATSAAAAPLRISYAAIAANIAGIWMAEGSGAFQKYGLDVQFVYIPSSGTNVQALLGGSIDVMVAGSSGIVSAAARERRWSRFMFSPTLPSRIN